MTLLLLGSSNISRGIFGKRLRAGTLIFIYKATPQTITNRFWLLGHIRFTWVILKRIQPKKFNCMGTGGHRLSWFVVIIKIVAKAWLLLNIDPPEHNTHNGLCARRTRKYCCHVTEFTHKVGHIDGWRAYQRRNFWRVRARFDDSKQRRHGSCLVYSLHVSSYVCLQSFSGTYEWTDVSKKSKKLHFMMQLPLLFVTRKVRPCAVKLQVRNKYVIQDFWRLEQRLGLLAFRLAGTNFNTHLACYWMIKGIRVVKMMCSLPLRWMVTNYVMMSTYGHFCVIGSAEFKDEDW